MRIWSIVIPLLVALPNLLWAKFPPMDTLQKSQPARSRNRFLEVCEQIGRMSVFVVPLFYLPHPAMRGYRLALALMGVSLLVYYCGWFRFFSGGRHATQLLQPLWLLPIPLAISPVIYFASAALLLQSWPMLVAASVLGLGHIPLSYREYLQST